MKRLFIIAIWMFLITSISHAAVDNELIITGTDHILYYNYGIDSGYDWPVATISPGESDTTLVTLSTGYILLGVGVYSTNDVLVTFVGTGINCVEDGASADSLSNCFNPAGSFAFWPFKDVDSVIIYNSSGESCEAYISVRAKR